MSSFFNRNHKAGKVLGEGNYGCIVSPAYTCDGHLLTFLVVAVESKRISLTLKTIKNISFFQ